MSKILRALKKKERETTYRAVKEAEGVIFTHRKAWMWRLPVMFLSPGSIMTKESFSLQRLVVIFRDKDSEHSLYSMKISHLMKPFPKSA